MDRRGYAGKESRRTRARQQPVKSYSLADLALPGEELSTKGYQIRAVHPPERSHQVALITGSAQEIAASLLEKIQESR